MNSPSFPVRVLYQMVRADFLERTRRYSFLLTLGLSLWLGYTVYAGQVNLLLGQYKGQPNSAWTGCVIGLVATVWLSLIGFYIVKNSIQRDRETGVGQILATTPMSRLFYTLAKALSNLAVLALMIFILAAAAILIQFLLQLHGGYPVRILPLIAPVLVFGLCALSVTAALAILFETLPILRTGVGNILYFFLWIALLATSVTHIEHSSSSAAMHLTDFTGLTTIMSQMQSQVRALDPVGYQGGSSFSVGGLTRANKTFVWNGIQWSPAIFLSRAFWIALALSLTSLAALFFDRFDPARSSITAQIRARRKNIQPQISHAETASIPFHQSHTRLTPLRHTASRSRFLALIQAEFRLMARGHSWWWYLVAAGLIAGTLFAPLQDSRGGLILVAWLWPALLWSQMGTREARFSTGPLIFSAPRAFPRQLLAVWAAGVAVTALTGSGLGLRLLILQDWPALTAWASAALFIPALALTLGVLTQSRKPFEALYIAWWYVGPLHHLPRLDFMATTSQSATPGIYATATLALILTACLWHLTRRRLA